jgi:hypothetical protein
MKVVGLALLLLAVSACAHHPSKVDCDGHLTPINPPNPVAKASVGSATP